ncbi:MAG: hypothetical protein FWD92_02580 [Methanomassiliicoccaceae archaeon]|nr:hypothetical protein [Methanomassiliicoccaceae archaeon]
MNTERKYGGLGDYTPKQVMKVLKKYTDGRFVEKEDEELMKILSSMNLVRFGMDHDRNERTAVTTDMGVRW